MYGSSHIENNTCSICKLEQTGHLQSVNFSGMVFINEDKLCDDTEVMLDINPLEQSRIELQSQKMWLL